jgi:hypothetical protein
MEVYPDPLRKNGAQACIWTQLVCAICGRDLNGPRAEGLIDIKTGKSYCGATHYEQRERKTK